MCTGDARVGVSPSTGAASSAEAANYNGGKGLGEPFFADAFPGAGGKRGGAGGYESDVINVTAQLGITTYLHCRVNSLGGKTVSWRIFRWKEEVMRKSIRKRRAD